VFSYSHLIGSGHASAALAAHAIVTDRLKGGKSDSKYLILGWGVGAPRLTTALRAPLYPGASRPRSVMRCSAVPPRLDDPGQTVTLGALEAMKRDRA
jgi:hypothetical protein